MVNDLADCGCQVARRRGKVDSRNYRRALWHIGGVTAGRPLCLCMILRLDCMLTLVAVVLSCLCVDPCVDKSTQITIVVMVGNARVLDSTRATHGSTGGSARHNYSPPCLLACFTLT